MVCLRRLQLNPAKTELIWFGSRTNLKTIVTQDVSLCVDSNIIQHVDVVRDLGVTFDSELTMQRHINTVTRACFRHIRRLKQIRRLIGKDVAAGLVFAFILSRLDYCNAVLTGLPKSTIAPLQRVQTRLQDLWHVSDREITSLLPFAISTGCLFNIVSPTNCV